MQKFVFASGSTGDSSRIWESAVKSSDLGNTFARDKLGLIESDPMEMPSELLIPPQ
jgi:hypothetical protein